MMVDWKGQGQLDVVGFCTAAAARALAASCHLQQAVAAAASNCCLLRAACRAVDRGSFGKTRCDVLVEA